MKVWVQALEPLPTFEVLLSEPPDRALFHKREADVAGAAGMALVDRVPLAEALRQGNDFGAWCGWPGCEYTDDGDPHSGTCPLRVEP